jgi:hypothetical protein
MPSAVGRKNEGPVCDFVRSILSAESGTAVEITAYPDREGRPGKNVEQLWESKTHAFAIEHTLVESFVGQLTDDAKFDKLIAPIEAQLAGNLPGTYRLGVDVGVSTDARVRYDDAQRRIRAAVIEAAPNLAVDKAVTLTIEGIPFPVYLSRRSQDGSKILVRRFVSDVEPSRLDRIRRALADKCPKLLAARTEGRLSILALESNDGALANYNVVGLAVEQALKERDDPPDLVMLVETDGLFYGWVIRNETGIQLRDGFYMEGDF